MVIRVVVTVITVLLLTACAGTKSISDKQPDKKLSEREQFEYQYRFMEANRAKLNGDLVRAVSLFQESLKINPRSDVANYELSNIYTALGDIDKALIFSQNALKIDRFNKWYYFQLARLYQVNDQPEKAVQVYTDLVKKFPDEVEYKITLAGLLIDNAQHKEAHLVLNRIEGITGLTEIVSITRHNIFIETGEFEKAFNEIQRLINHFPNEIRYQGILAELFARLGMDKQAIEAYQKILKINPDYGIAHFSLAEFYRTRGMIKESFPHYGRAFRDEFVDLKDKISVAVSLYEETEVRDNYTLEIMQLIELLVSLGKEVPEVRFLAADFFIKTDNLSRAIIELQSLINFIPDYYPVMEQLIIVLSFESRYEDLVEYAQLANERFPGTTLVQYFLGIGLYQTGRYPRAIEIMELALKTDSLDLSLKTSFLLMLGDANNKIGDYEKSDHYFKESLLNEPDNTIALNNWAYYLSVRGEDLEKAERMSRVTIDKEPENSTFLDTYAWVLFKKGDYENALLYIEKAISFNASENAEVLDHYGDILIKNGRIGEAIGAWKKAYELEENRSEILIKIKENEK